MAVYSWGEIFTLKAQREYFSEDKEVSSVSEGLRRLWIKRFASTDLSLTEAMVYMYEGSRAADISDQMNAAIRSLKNARVPNDQWAERLQSNPDLNPELAEIKRKDDLEKKQMKIALSENESDQLTLLAANFSKLTNRLNDRKNAIQHHIEKVCLADWARACRSKGISKEKYLETYEQSKNSKNNPVRVKIADNETKIRAVFTTHITTLENANVISKKCDFVSTPTVLPPKGTLTIVKDEIETKCDAAYVVSGSRLFYINKIKARAALKETDAQKKQALEQAACIEIKIDSAALEKLRGSSRDEALREMTTLIGHSRDNELKEAVRLDTLAKTSCDFVLTSTPVLPAKSVVTVVDEIKTHYDAAYVVSDPGTRPGPRLFYIDKIKARAALKETDAQKKQALEQAACVEVKINPDTLIRLQQSPIEDALNEMPKATGHSHENELRKACQSLLSKSDDDTVRSCEEANRQLNRELQLRNEVIKHFDVYGLEGDNDPVYVDTHRASPRHSYAKYYENEVKTGQKPRPPFTWSTISGSNKYHPFYYAEVLAGMVGSGFCALGRKLMSVSFQEQQGFFGKSKAVVSKAAGAISWVGGAVVGTLAEGIISIFAKLLSKSTYVTPPTHNGRVVPAGGPITPNGAAVTRVSKQSKVEPTTPRRGVSRVAAVSGATLDTAPSTPGLRGDVTNRASRVGGFALASANPRRTTAQSSGASSPAHAGSPTPVDNAVNRDAAAAGATLTVPNTSAGLNTSQSLQSSGAGTPVHAGVSTPTSSAVAARAGAATLAVPMVQMSPLHKAVQSPVFKASSSGTPVNAGSSTPTGGAGTARAGAAARVHIPLNILTALNHSGGASTSVNAGSPASADNPPTHRRGTTPARPAEPTAGGAYFRRLATTHNAGTGLSIGSTGSMGSVGSMDSLDGITSPPPVAEPTDNAQTQPARRTTYQLSVSRAAGVAASDAAAASSTELTNLRQAPPVPPINLGVAVSPAENSARASAVGLTFAGTGSTTGLSTMGMLSLRASNSGRDQQQTGTASPVIRGVEGQPPASLTLQPPGSVAASSPKIRGAR